MHQPEGRPLSALDVIFGRRSASAMGLGTCCIGSAVPVLSSPDIKNELSIPDDVEVVVPIIVGVQSGPGADIPRKEPLILSWI